MNPVIAVLVGYFLGGEAIGPRTVAGTVLVLVSVIIITTTPKKVELTSSLTEAVSPELVRQSEDGPA